MQPKDPSTPGRSHRTGEGRTEPERIRRSAGGDQPAGKDPGHVDTHGSAGDTLDPEEGPTITGLRETGAAEEP